MLNNSQYTIRIQYIWILWGGYIYRESAPTDPGSYVYGNELYIEDILLFVFYNIPVLSPCFSGIV